MHVTTPGLLLVLLLFFSHLAISPSPMTGSFVLKLHLSSVKSYRSTLLQGRPSPGAGQPVNEELTDLYSTFLGLQ